MASFFTLFIPVIVGGSPELPDGLDAFVIDRRASGEYSEKMWPF